MLRKPHLHREKFDPLRKGQFWGLLTEATAERPLLNVPVPLGFRPNGSEVRLATAARASGRTVTGCP